MYRGNPTVPEQDASAPAAARAPALDQVPAPVHEPDIVPVSGKTRSWEKPNAGRSEAYKRIDAAFADLMQRKQAPAASPAALPAYKPSASAHQLPEEFEIRLPSDEDYVWSRYGLQGDGEHPRGWDHEAQLRLSRNPSHNAPLCNGSGIKKSGSPRRAMNHHEPTVCMVRWSNALDGSIVESLLLNVLASRSAPKLSGEEGDW